MFLPSNSIVRSYERIVSMFSQQLDGGDHIPFMSGNILVITELVSLVNCMCTIYMQILLTVFLANFSGHYLLFYCLHLILSTLYMGTSLCKVLRIKAIKNSVFY